MCDYSPFMELKATFIIILCGHLVFIDDLKLSIQFTEILSMCSVSRIKIAPPCFFFRLLLSMKPGGQAAILPPTGPALGLSVLTGPLLPSLVPLYFTDEQPEWERLRVWVGMILLWALLPHSVPPAPLVWSLRQSDWLGESQEKLKMSQ